MSDFGDVDPEDAFDGSDAAAEQVRVLALVVPSIESEQAGEHDRVRVRARIAWGLRVVRRLRQERPDDDRLGPLHMRLVDLDAAEGP